MKKILSGICALLCVSSIYAAPAISTIQLDIPNNGLVPSPNTTLSIPLTSLFNDTLYEVTCTIENPDPKDGTDLRFNYFNVDTGSLFNLNGKDLQSSQGTANPNEVPNTLKFRVMKSAADKSAAFTVTNLDTYINKPVRIFNCSGQPVIGVK